MARGGSSNGDTASADTATAGEAPASTETAAATEGNDSRFVMLNVPEGDPSGLSGQQKRVDVIRALAKTGEWERGRIAKHISQLQGSKVAYQIVFQATRGIPNVKKAERQEAAPATAEGAPAAEAATA
jgi:hypothetical protein